MSGAESRLAEAARRVAEQLPPLTQEQRERLRTLLAPALDKQGDSPARTIAAKRPVKS